MAFSIQSRIDAEPPVTFGGRLEPATARGVIARRIAASRSGGDYRDWDRIREWARTVAAHSVPTPAHH